MVSFAKPARVVLGVTMLSALMACAGPDVANGIYDPNESQNRGFHAFNLAVDTAVLRPASKAYGGTLPEPVRIGVGNFAGNLSLPGAVVNDLLQLNIKDAVHNSVRFLMNSTIGLGGILDPAMSAGIEPRDSDFGETMYVWGFKEGAYIELPFVGPSTTRDAVGMVVDLFLDPVNRLVPANQRIVLPLTALAAKVGDRYRFSNTVDSVLYDSTDGYAQSRLLYLENRRFQLGIEAVVQDDLYEGLYNDLLSQ
jgi:phospholipid-binding lipoprotein MlaA